MPLNHSNSHFSRPLFYHQRLEKKKLCIFVDRHLAKKSTVAAHIRKVHTLFLIDTKYIFFDTHFVWRIQSILIVCKIHILDSDLVW